MIKSAKDFLAAANLKRDKITVRGQEFHYREMSVGERSVVLASKDSGDLPSLVVSMCATDPDGKSLFTKEQAAEIAQAAPEVVDKIAEAVLRLSGLGNDAKNA